MGGADGKGLEPHKSKKANQSNEGKGKQRGVGKPGQAFSSHDTVLPTQRWEMPSGIVHGA